MATSRWERLAPLTGVVFVVLTAVGVIFTMSGSPEDFPAPTDEIVQYYNEETDAILAGGWIGLVGGLFLIWFGASVRAHLREAGEERTGTIAFGGAVAAAVVGFVIDGVNVMAALRADEFDEIDPQVATAMFDLANGMVGTGLPIAIATFVAATSVAAFRSRALPVWLAALGVIVVIGLLILPIAWMFTAVALVWALITSVVIYMRQPAAPAVTPGGPPSG